ncbi:MAG: hypothetical protein WC856_26505 [Methylococcaceae bacterium]|jgi:hypothetical protein
MSKLSKDQWRDLRSKWEADPKLTFGTLAIEYGINQANHLFQITKGKLGAAREFGRYCPGGNTAR